MANIEREMQKEWDNIYTGRDPAVYKNHKTYQDGLMEVIKLWKTQGVETVLDLGCGIGRNSLQIKKNGFNVFGIDISLYALTLLDSNLHTQNSVEGSFSNLPFADESFDAVLAARVLQHGSLESIQTGIKEISRILKPKGTTFVTVCGRFSHGEVRPNLIKTATKIKDRLYVPNYGQEKGVTHYIFNKKNIKKTFRNFSIPKIWKDSDDYYCFLAYKK